MPGAVASARQSSPSASRATVRGSPTGTPAESGTATDVGHAGHDLEALLAAHDRLGVGDALRAGVGVAGEQPHDGPALLGGRDELGAGGLARRGEHQLGVVAAQRQHRLGDPLVGDDEVGGGAAARRRGR